MKRKCKIVTDSNVDIKLILIRIFWRLIVVNLIMLKYKIVSDSNVPKKTNVNLISRLIFVNVVLMA